MQLFWAANFEMHDFKLSSICLVLQILTMIEKLTFYFPEWLDFSQHKKYNFIGETVTS